MRAEEDASAAVKLLDSTIEERFLITMDEERPIKERMAVDARIF
jgi:hypothetical protein